MNAVIELARPEIRALDPYHAAQYEDGLVRLNANETPWPAPGDRDNLNRYPEERPALLTQAMARHFGLKTAQVLVTRGSSDAIDLLLRCFCRAGRDEIVICPPTFGMYRVYADIQGAGVREIPLQRSAGFWLDADGIVNAWQPNSKLLFLCSPNNPTGNRFPDQQLDRICSELAKRAVVVVDAAYIEFADADPTLDLIDRHDNVVVLRTLSKACGLAGIRCGALLGPAEVVSLLGRLLPPYCFPTPSQQAALRSLNQANRVELAGRVETLVAERERLAAGLSELRTITRVWPSEANFLLAESSDPARTVNAARKGGLLIRDFSQDTGLEGCLRITVGSPEQNDQLLQSFKDDECR